MSTKTLIESLAKDAKPSKKRIHPAAELKKWLLMAMLLVAGLISVLGIRPDIMERLQNGMYVTELVLVLLIAVTASKAACWLAVPDINQQQFVRWIPLIPFALLSLFLIYRCINAYGEDPMDAVYREYMAKRYDCAMDLILFSVVPGVLLFFIMRRAAPVHFYWAGSMAALAVTHLSYLSLRLLEVNDDSMHLLLWHYFPMAACSLLGMFIGKWALRW